MAPANTTESNDARAKRLFFRLRCRDWGFLAAACLGAPALLLAMPWCTSYWIRSVVLTEHSTRLLRGLGPPLGRIALTALFVAPSFVAGCAVGALIVVFCTRRILIGAAFSTLTLASALVIFTPLNTVRWMALANVAGGQIVCPLLIVSLYSLCSKLRRQGQEVSQLIPCESCGYSLVGNTSGICPECGGRLAGAGQGGEPGSASS